MPQHAQRNPRQWLRQHHGLGDRGVQYLISLPLYLTSNCTQALLSEGSQLQILIFHSCPLVTEQSRHTLETFLSNVGRRMRQVTWTVY